MIPNSAMKARLLNHYEEVTYPLLNSACAPNDAKVFPKVRIGDVFCLKGSGVSDAHYSYGLRAHFDFLVTNCSYQPLFSVEFDGPVHKRDSTQKARDNLKNQLCDHFEHSLLRINSRYLTKQYRGLDLLTYFVDAWFLEQAFLEAQKNGLVPYDEPFDIMLIVSNGSKPGRKWPYWLSLDIQLDIQKLHREGVVSQMAPSYYVGIDDDQNYRCLAWLTLGAGGVVYVTTGMRMQRFPGVFESELIYMLATFDLHQKLGRTLRGEAVLRVDRQHFFGHVLRSFQGTYRMASAGDCGPASQ